MTVGVRVYFWAPFSSVVRMSVLCQHHSLLLVLLSQDSFSGVPWASIRIQGMFSYFCESHYGHFDWDCMEFEIALGGVVVTVLSLSIHEYGIFAFTEVSFFVCFSHFILSSFHGGLSSVCPALPPWSD